MSCSNFPHVSKEKFFEMIQTFEEICSKVPTQDWNDWKTVSKRDTILRITRRSWIPKEYIGNEDKPTNSQDIEDNEIDSDPDVIPVKHDEDPELVVEYDIAYSNSYQVPVLYMAIYGPGKQPVLDLDKVYKYIVPKSFATHLKDNDILGAISSTYHPDTGFPVFTINPCQTADAMSKFDSKSLLDYFIAWLGLIGGAVGLHIPSLIIYQYVSQPR